MIAKLARYYYYKLRGSKFLDFIDHGFGIEARFSRHKKAWHPHLSSCKDFLIKSIEENRLLQNTAFKDICILGAGRLLDIPQLSFSKNFDKIYLVDADPTCMSAWQKFKRNSQAEVAFEFSDISSRLEQWSDSLILFFKNQKIQNTSNLESLITTNLEFLLNQTIQKQWPCPKTEIIVSLNLLSQIGVYWRDRVFSIFKKYCPQLIIDDQIHSKQIELIISKMINLLESEHLELLLNSKAKFIITLYDDELYYYSKKQSQWQTENAISTQSDLNLPGFKTTHSKCWLWHIVPQGSEHKDYGEIHRVQARCFLRQ